MKEIEDEGEMNGEWCKLGAGPGTLVVASIHALRGHGYLVSKGQGLARVSEDFRVNPAVAVDYLPTGGAGIRPRIFIGLIENEQAVIMPIDPPQAI